MRHILQYLVMVGGPVAGLLGVLHLGKDLPAPMSVRGSYRVQLTGGPASPCLEQILADSLMEITQSGPRLEIRLGKLRATLAGWVEGNLVDASGPAPAIQDCPPEDSIRFTGRATRGALDVVLEGQLGPRTMRGTRPRRPRR